MDDPVLSEKRVASLVSTCLTGPDEPRDGALFVEGILTDYSFSQGRIRENAMLIGQMLAELPDQFHHDKGGGWSFLNACMDRQGNQWADQHRRMEDLFCLGIAAGKADWLLPREAWGELTGGMPWVVVRLGDG
jgi:hypothetical protein